ncbi:E3 ubiquitin-protein ligase ICP0 [Carex littledalei]|uniref:E3 ubiquitin-protein ligase ICP0 n=1 Tax=Carex littledalei TaxID=544730 RepID=A0A833VFJ8_9POAL|nr:E3 ubiquitin-protein ligase ICP0 [Carex littledalei]
MATETVDQAQLDCLATESGRDLKEVGCGGESGSADFGFCAICLEKIVLQETALVKGCEHAYCVTCILRWASYKDNPLCPQCKHPFESLSVHRSLDGCIHDYMFEESVCLLLRAVWFIPLTIEPHEEVHDETDDIYPYYYAEELEEDEEDLESYYMRGNSSTIRIGNRRWGDNGYVRAGRKEARPVRQNLYIDDDGDVSLPRLCSSSSSSRKKDKEKVDGEGSSSKDCTGRRAKRAMKREAADRLAAARHQHRLQRFGFLDAINDRMAATQD